MGRNKSLSVLTDAIAKNPYVSCLNNKIAIQKCAQLHQMLSIEHQTISPNLLFAYQLFDMSNQFRLYSELLPLLYDCPIIKSNFGNVFELHKTHSNTQIKTGYFIKIKK